MRCALGGQQGGARLRRRQLVGLKVGEQLPDLRLKQIGLGQQRHHLIRRCPQLLRALELLLGRGAVTDLQIALREQHARIAIVGVLLEGILELNDGGAVLAGGGGARGGGGGGGRRGGGGRGRGARAR